MVECQYNSDKSGSPDEETERSVVLTPFQRFKASPWFPHFILLCCQVLHPMLNFPLHLPVPDTPHIMSRAALLCGECDRMACHGSRR